jgi:GTPase involved in cell partitioning and DNA repair
MLQFSYATWRQFFAKIFSAFGEFYKVEENKKFENVEHLLTDEQSRFKVSLNDLKMISSALLFYKKSLLKKNELLKVNKVATLDNRLYQLIVDLEQKQLQKQASETISA